jgi:hypothetical protein
MATVAYRLLQAKKVKLIRDLMNVINEPLPQRMYRIAS